MQKEKALTFQLLLEKSELVSGRSGEIRTRGLLNPIQARYQAALHPELKAHGLQTDIIIPQAGEKSRDFGKIGTKASDAPALRLYGLAERKERSPVRRVVAFRARQAGAPLVHAFFRAAHPSRG